MSVLSAIQTYIKTYSDLKTDAPVWVNYLGDEPIEYTIVPLAGARIVEEYINGGTSREFPFALQSVESTVDDLGRLASQEFYEAFAEWLRTQTEADNLPTLASGQTAFKIEALGNGFMFQQGESQTGVYQI